MVSIWWVAAAFFIGSFAGAVLIALLAMARIQDDDLWHRGSSEYRGAPGAKPSTRKHAARNAVMLGLAALLLLGLAGEAGYVGASFRATDYATPEHPACEPAVARPRSVATRQPASSIARRLSGGNPLGLGESVT